MTELRALDGSTKDGVGSGGAGLTLQEIAVIVRGTVAGARCDLRFRSVAPLDRAGRRDLGLLSNRRYLSGVADTDAGALLVARELTEEIQPGIPRVEVSDPSQALASLLPVLHPLESEPPEVHESVSLDAGVQLGAGVSIGPFSVIGKGAQIGNGSRIGSHVFVGAGCEVGEGCTIHPHVTLYSGTRLGDRVIVHAGANLGVDGFGYATDAEGHRKVQQVGRCLIEKDVEIGAGTCIDRGSIGDTVIGAGTKIDNLVHIAHNVRIGPRSIIIAQVGIAGSTRIGAGVVLGGQAGFVGHINIGDGARIGGQAGVIGDVAPGTEVIGFPARPRREFLRGMANAMKLGALKKRVSQLECDITARSEATPADADELE